MVSDQNIDGVVICLQCVTLVRVRSDK